MSSYVTWLNVLTGISQGLRQDLHKRCEREHDRFAYSVKELGSGITDLNSNSSELVVTTSGTNKILTLNLSGYVANTALTNAMAAYTVTTALATFYGRSKIHSLRGLGSPFQGPPYPPGTGPKAPNYNPKAIARAPRGLRVQLGGN